MSELDETVASTLAKRYKANAARVRELAVPLADAQFWQKPFPFGNSFGHLVLHLTGNLNYYVGAQIANTGYVRDRPSEFNEPNPPSKDEASSNSMTPSIWFSKPSMHNRPKIGRQNIQGWAPTPKTVWTLWLFAQPTYSITSAR